MSRSTENQQMVVTEKCLDGVDSQQCSIDTQNSNTVCRQNYVFHRYKSEFSIKIFYFIILLNMTPILQAPGNQCWRKPLYWWFQISNGLCLSQNFTPALSQTWACSVLILFSWMYSIQNLYLQNHFISFYTFHE